MMNLGRQKERRKLFMNKLFTKIAGLALGLSMAIGVGVAATSFNKEALRVDAATATMAYTGSTTTNMTATGNAATVGLDSSIFTVNAGRGTQSGGGAGNFPGLNKNGYIALYAQTGCTITVSVASGYVINSITIAYSGSYGPATVTVGGVEVTGTNNVFQIAGSSFVLSDGLTGQVRMTSVSIDYGTASQNINVTYNANGATSGTVPTDNTNYEKNASVTVLGNTGNLSKGEKFVFAGWTINPNGTGTIYGPSEGQTHTYTITSSTTFYAKWNQVKYTVSYDGNGNTSGNVPASATNYNAGENVTVLGNVAQSPLVKTGYSFSGWNTAANGGGTSYSAGDTISSINADITLYAVWQESETTITGTSWTYTFTSKTFDPLNGTKLLSGLCGETETKLNWTLSATGVSYTGYDGTKGQQIGSGSDAASSASLSSTSFSSLNKITSVTVETSGASSVVATVSVVVGNKNFKCNSNESVSISSTNTSYAFTGNGSGNISINWNQSSSKGLYVKKITVAYEIEASVVATEISVSGPTAVDGQDETSAQATYTYDVTYQAGKAGTKSNVEVSVSPAAYATVGTVSNQQFTVTFKRATSFAITVSSTETMGVEGTINVTVTNVVLTGYSKLSSEVNLYAGAKLLIVDPDSNMAAGALDEKNRLTGETVTIDSDHIATNAVGNALEFTLGGTVGNWTLTSSEGLLGTKEIKKLVYDDADATTTWSITISNTVGSVGKATIASNGEDLGRILFNASSGQTITDYFTNYSSATTTTNRLPEIYIKAAENKIYNFIENTMRMGDTALAGNGSDACKDSGYYLNAKKALAALSSTDRGKFQDNDGSKYTAALARYNAWALANHDNAPFNGATTISSAPLIGIINEQNSSVITIIVVISMIGITAVGGYFFMRKRKEN